MSSSDNNDDEPQQQQRLTLRNARAYHSPEVYPNVRFLIPKAECRRLNRRGARIRAEACMHARGDPTLTLELDVGGLLPLVVVRRRGHDHDDDDEEDDDGCCCSWVQLRTANVTRNGRRARVVLEVTV